MMELRLKVFLMCIFGTGCLVRKCIAAAIYVFLISRRRSSPLHHDTWHISSSGWIMDSFSVSAVSALRSVFSVYAFFSCQNKLPLCMQTKTEFWPNGFCLDTFLTYETKKIKNKSDSRLLFLFWEAKQFNQFFPF